MISGNMSLRKFLYLTRRIGFSDVTFSLSPFSTAFTLEDKQDFEAFESSKLSFSSLDSSYFSQESGGIVPKGLYDPCLASRERSACSIGKAVDRFEYLIAELKSDTVFSNFLKAGYLIYSIVIYNDTGDSVTISITNNSSTYILSSETIPSESYKLFFFHEGDFNSFLFNPYEPSDIKIMSTVWSDPIQFAITTFKIYEEAEQ